MQRCAGHPQARPMRKPAHLHSAMLCHREEPVQVPETVSPHRNISLGYSTGPSPAAPSQDLDQLSSHGAAGYGMETEQRLNRRAQAQHVSSKHRKETAISLGHLDVSSTDLQRKTLGNQVCSV